VKRGPAALDVLGARDGAEERRICHRLAEPVDRAFDEGDLRRGRVAHAVQVHFQRHAR